MSWLAEARDRKLQWLGKLSTVRADAKAINKETDFWIQQLQKAKNQDGMTYGKGIIDKKKYPLNDKMDHLIAHLKKKEGESWVAIALHLIAFVLIPLNLFW